MTHRTQSRLARPAGAIAALGLALACVYAATTVAASDVAIGAEVPDVALQDETGKEHKLSDYRGKLVVFEWTNPECPFVKRHYDANTMEKLSQTLGAKGVVWLAVNSTYTNEPKDTLAWREQQGFEYATLQDREGKLGRLLGARTTPHMFIVDPDGKLAYKGAIDDDPNGRSSTPKRYVSTAAEALLGGAKADPADTQPYGCSVKYAR
jgi:peroxiredoxin